MIAKTRKDGATAYYWNPPQRDIEAGFPLSREALGTDYASACIRCDGHPNDPEDTGLNGFLDSYRAGSGAVKDLDLIPGFGTVDWWIARYLQSTPYRNLSTRSQSDYRKYLTRISDVATKDGRRFGDLPLMSITPAAVDRLYERLSVGPRGPRLRQANHEMDTARRAWTVIQRRYAAQFPDNNPFVGLERVRTTGTVKEATREQAYALAFTLREIGHAPLGAAALICFEWLQRPENVLAGWISWSHYRPLERPNHVRITHHKTGEVVWHPLEHEGEQFYPEIEEYLATVPRLGVPIVLMSAKRGEPRPYVGGHPRRMIRVAREMAGLPSHVTLAACRHGGLTELGDAELTEQQGMALSAHKTASAYRLYVKRTEHQRLAATKRRRAWVNQNAGGT